jgi:hypothetical protein
MGYSLEGADFLYTTPWPSLPTVSHFDLRALPSLQFNPAPSTESKIEV